MRLARHPLPPRGWQGETFSTERVDDEGDVRLNAGQPSQVGSVGVGNYPAAFRCHPCRPPGCHPPLPHAQRHIFLRTAYHYRRGVLLPSFFSPQHSGTPPPLCFCQQRLFSLYLGSLRWPVIVHEVPSKYLLQLGLLGQPCDLLELGDQPGIG